MTEIEILRMSLENLVKFCDDPKNKFELGPLSRDLDHVAVEAAQKAAYVRMRHGPGCGDQGHTKAVKEFNRVRKKVRATCDFSYPERPINF